MQGYKDGSRLQFIKFDFVKGGQEIKITRFWWNLSFLAVTSSPQFIFLCGHHFWRFFYSYFKIIKQAPGIIIKTRYFSLDAVSIKLLFVYF